ncbi:MAG: metallophosphoesterase [bacterium]
MFTQYTSFKFFPRNRSGRDFVVGDIHGMFAALDALLAQVDFSPTTDRLFALGDLIDRGTESARALDYLCQPWFYAIKGNHEFMLLDAAIDHTAMNNWIKHNGGEWWLNIPDTLKKQLREQIAYLPLAIEVQTDYGHFGLVHANMPFNLNWQTFIKNLHYDADLQDYALWSRERLKRYQFDRYSATVIGVDWLLVGHSPLDRPKCIANVYFLDTGAAFIDEVGFGHLTMMEITHPQQPLHQIDATQHLALK